MDTGRVGLCGRDEGRRGWSRAGRQSIAQQTVWAERVVGAWTAGQSGPAAGGTQAVVSLAGAGIELTLQIQDTVGLKTTLKEFTEKLAGAEDHQRALAALRAEVESFAALFPLPGLPDF